jgi:hypothetical protein
MAAMMSVVARVIATVHITLSLPVWRAKEHNPARVKYWEIIADSLSKPDGSVTVSAKTCTTIAGMIDCVIAVSALRALSFRLCAESPFLLSRAARLYSSFTK